MLSGDALPFDGWQVTQIADAVTAWPNSAYSSRFGASMNLRHAGQVKIGP